MHKLSNVLLECAVFTTFIALISKVGAVLSDVCWIYGSSIHAIISAFCSCWPNLVEDSVIQLVILVLLFFLKNEQRQSRSFHLLSMLSSINSWRIQKSDRVILFGLSLLLITVTMHSSFESLRYLARTSAYLLAFYGHFDRAERIFLPTRHTTEVEDNFTLSSKRLAWKPGQYDAIAPRLQNAVQTVYGAESAEMAQEYVTLASYSAWNHDHDRAEALCLRALNIYAKYNEPSKTIVALSLLADVERFQQKTIQASLILNRATAIARAQPQSIDAQYLRVLASSLEQMGMLEEANEFNCISKERIEEDRLKHEQNLLERISRTIELVVFLLLSKSAALRILIANGKAKLLDRLSSTDQQTVFDALDNLVSLELICKNYIRADEYSKHMLFLVESSRIRHMARG